MSDDHPQPALDVYLQAQRRIQGMAFYTAVYQFQSVVCVAACRICVAMSVRARTGSAAGMRAEVEFSASLAPLISAPLEPP